MSASFGPIPPGSVLVHIGPYKTSTTALQAALFDVREEMERHGVHYCPDDRRRAMHQGWSLVGWAPPGRPQPAPEVWDEFASGIREVMGARPDLRTCISSEDFCLAARSDVRRLVADLGGPDRVHVLMAARRIDRLLPSAWQEWVKTQQPLEYEPWLRDVLDPSDTSRHHRVFWGSEDVRWVTSRWLEAGVSPQNIHLVVFDDFPRDTMMRAAEQLLALPDGILVPPPGMNAAMSANMTELLRLMTLTFEEQEWPDHYWYQLLYRGAFESSSRAPFGEGDVRVPPPPAWATTEILRRVEEQVTAVRTLGLDVIGDPEALRMPADELTDERLAPTPDTISMVQVAAALEGVVSSTQRMVRSRRDMWRERVRASEEARAEVEKAARKALRQAERRAKRRAAREAARREADGPLLRDASGRELLGALSRRVKRRLGR